MTSKIETAIEQTEDAIENTRDRVRQHIDGLQRDLSPSAMINQLVPEGHSLSETFREVADAARRNPLATALVTGGAMLLGREVVYGRNEHRIARLRATSENAAERVGEHVSDLKRSAENAANRGAEAAGSIAASAREGVDSAKQKVDDAISAGQDAADQAYHAGRAQLKQTSREAVAAANTGKRWVEENPVATGLACVAAGALIASFFTARPVPPARNENDRQGADRPASVKPRKARVASKPKKKTTSKSKKTTAARKSRSNSSGSPKATSVAKAPAVKARAANNSVSNAGGMNRPGSVSPTSGSSNAL